jgi:hypothetical protein
LLVEAVKRGESRSPANDRRDGCGNSPQISLMDCRIHRMEEAGGCLRMSQYFAESLRALPVIQGVSVAAEDQLRRPIRARPEPVDPVASYGSVDDGLRAYPGLVDDERVDEAEALLRGLIASGASPAALRHTLLTAVTDHFLAYGH